MNTDHKDNHNENLKTSSSENVIKHDPIVKESVHEHHVHEVQPVIHKEHEKEHVHKHVEHVVEPGDKLKTEVHHEGSTDSTAHSTGGHSLVDKVKKIFHKQ